MRAGGVSGFGGGLTSVNRRVREKRAERRILRPGRLSGNSGDTILNSSTAVPWRKDVLQFFGAALIQYQRVPLVRPGLRRAIQYNKLLSVE